MIMTRKDKLYSMKTADLIKLAESYDLTVLCNRSRSALLESKSEVIDRILGAEQEVRDADR